MSYENTYWSNEGKYQVEYDQMFNKLVPDFGSAETVAGEVVRAFAKIYYDAFNNGFLNNTSGPLNYLKMILEDQSSEELKNAIYILEGCVNTGCYTDLNEYILKALETMVNECMEIIMKNPEFSQTTNTLDMWDFRDEDEYPDEDDWYDDFYDDEEGY